MEKNDTKIYIESQNQMLFGKNKIKINAIN